MTNSLSKVLITGGNGQIASAIKNTKPSDQLALHFLSRKEFDLNKPQQIDDVLRHFSPDIVINTAAYTAVDQAESDQELAEQINHLGSQNLAKVCNKQNIKLIHLSTDYVFDGKAKLAYDEQQTAKPINHYGMSKLRGEDAVRELCPKHIILRVSAVFGEFAHNFLKTMLRLASQKEKLSIVEDQTTCPTYAGDIADVLMQLCKNTDMIGTYHFCGEPAVSWYEFACEIINQARETGFPIKCQEISPTTSEAFKTAAKRPKFAVLDNQKILAALELKPRYWQQGIKTALVALKEADHDPNT